MNIQPLPPTYRAAEVEHIIKALCSGDSCSVVGIGSVGKSNLMRFLQRDDVHRAYLNPDQDACLFVYVDVNKMLKKSFWGLQELMLHQLLIELTNQEVDSAILQTLDDLHRRATNPQTRNLVLRYLDRAIWQVCHYLGWRLIFLIDEFDELCRLMPPRSFGALRALRDDYKYRLMYVVATRLELKRLRENHLEIEAFEEIVSPHTIWLGTYSEDDARLMLHRLAARHQLALGDEIIEQICALTGRHPGLLREAYYAFRKQQPLSEDLIHQPSLQDEYRRIWFSLSREEQQAMVTLAGETGRPTPPAGAVDRLRDKGLIVKTASKTDQIFSPLFAHYLEQRHPAVNQRLHVDHERHTVWVDGYETRSLTPLEYKLIAFLEKHRGQVCSRDELAQQLYPDEIAETGVSDNRIDSVVKRLRKQIEPNPKEPQYILTMRGHGFRLVDGDEEHAG